MRFKDEQGRYYVVLTAGDWVFDGAQMVPVSTELTRVSVKVAAEPGSQHPPLLGDCGGPTPPSYDDMINYVVVPVTYADDDDAAGGLILPTTPGPAPAPCCELVASGDSKCSTEVKVEVI